MTWPSRWPRSWWHCPWLDTSYLNLEGTGGPERNAEDREAFRLRRDRALSYLAAMERQVDPTAYDRAVVGNGGSWSSGWSTAT
jgi:hypothetical protein